MKRAMLLSALGVTAVGLVIGSAAWACSPAAVTPFLADPSPNAAPVGATVVVTGRQWVPGANLDVRWEAVGGPLLTTVPVKADGTFSTEVTIPHAAPGFYHVIAVQGTSSQAKPFEVPVAGAFAPPLSGGVTSPPSPSGPAPGGVTDRRVSGGLPAPTPSGGLPAPTPSGGLAAPAPSGGPAVPAPSTGPAAPSGGLAAPAPSPAVAGPSAASPSAPAPRDGVPSSSAGQTADISPDAAAPGVGLDELGTGPVSSPAAAGPQPSETSAQVSAPSPARITSGDLWSGFASPDSPARAPSLLDLPSSTNGVERVESMLPLGVGLFTSALVALFAGFALAELRRRRATAS